MILKIMKSFELFLFRILCWLVWFTPGSEVTGQVLTANWTWLSGSNIGYQPGNYGTQGVISVNNHLRSRMFHSMVIHPNGQLIFVFGGTPAGDGGYLNDLWMFNVTSGWWTWLSGDNTFNQKGFYGIQGVASASHRPGARSLHSMTMHPSGQSIFVFGGWGYDITLTEGYLGDMWMFNVTSAWWTWLNGNETAADQVAIYGIQGVASCDNRPGARSAHSMAIHPTGELIFVFGGSGYDTSTTAGDLNDMWMLNTTSGWWTWVSGGNTAAQKGIYGIQGVASVNNQPGGRSHHSMGVHPSGQVIFIFGGWGYTEATLGVLSDMWMFDVTSGWWTWLVGDNTVNQKGFYGIQGVASVSNRPGARWLHSMVMHPSGQSIFVFGGLGYDVAMTQGYLGDMWMFNVTSAWWTWLSGSETADKVGVYGTQGVASVNNRPGARSSHSMAIHPSGQLIFVFGGWGYDSTGGSGDFNDMWTFSWQLNPTIQPSITMSSMISAMVSSLKSSQTITYSESSPSVPTQLNWWITVGPLTGFLILICAIINLFMFGFLGGFIYKPKLYSYDTSTTMNSLYSESSATCQSTRDTTNHSSTVSTLQPSTSGTKQTNTQNTDLTLQAPSSICSDKYSMNDKPS